MSWHKIDMRRRPSAATLDAIRANKKERRSHLLTVIVSAVIATFCAIRLFQHLPNGQVETMSRGADRTIHFADEPLAFAFWVAVYIVGVIGFGALSFAFAKQNLRRK
ncbi:hypothetical protein ACFQRC_09555 [Enterovirga sp. GCM10030262]|uniref:hypothetical protein n=1 Tax=Enterovirga sp. GCM10030262 TaxID=3273391 RepID=UPI0036206172